jgi:hypothetical protein
MVHLIILLESIYLSHISSVRFVIYDPISGFKIYDIGTFVLKIPCRLWYDCVEEGMGGREASLFFFFFFPFFFLGKTQDYMLLHEEKKEIENLIIASKEEKKRERKMLGF